MTRRGPILALGLGLTVALGLAGSFEAKVAAEEDAAITRITAPDCLRYAIHDPSMEKGRGWHPSQTAGPSREGTRRIVVVGDSVTFGLGVDADAAWPRRLHNWLQRQLGRKAIQLYNFAVSGYDAHQVACLLEHQIAEWEPDLVIWGAYINDGDETLILNAQGLAGPVFIAPSAPPDIQLLPAPLSQALLSHSAVWRRVLGGRVARLEGKRAPPGGSEERTRLAGGVTRVLTWSAETGLPVLVVALPPHVLADPAGCQSPPAAYWSCDALEDRQAMLHEVLAAQDADVVDPLPALRALGTGPWPLPQRPDDPDHPGAAGHDALTRVVLPEVQARLGLPVVSTESLEATTPEVKRKPPKRHKRSRPEP